MHIPEAARTVATRPPLHPSDGALFVLAGDDGPMRPDVLMALVSTRVRPASAGLTIGTATGRHPEVPMHTLLTPFDCSTAVVGDNSPSDSSSKTTPAAPTLSSRVEARRRFAGFAATDDEARYHFIVELHRTDAHLAESLALDEHGDLKAFGW